MLGFDWTFKIGDLITIVIVAVALLYRRGGEEAGTQISLKELTRELTEMKTEFKTFGDTLKKVAIQEVQIALLMKWYDELKRGEGFVRAGSKRNGIEGEYP